MPCLSSFYYFSMKMVHHVIKIVVTNVRFLKTSFLGKVKKKKKKNGSTKPILQILGGSFFGPGDLHLSTTCLQHPLYQGLQGQLSSYHQPSFLITMVTRQPWGQQTTYRKLKSNFSQYSGDKEIQNVMVYTVEVCKFLVTLEHLPPATGPSLHPIHPIILEVIASQFYLIT